MAKVFRANRTNEIGIYVVVLGSIAMDIHMLMLAVNLGYFFIATGLFLLWYMLFRTPTMVTVQSDKIIVQCRLARQDIPFSEVQDVKLVPGSGTWPRKTQGVELILTSNRKLLLGGGYSNFLHDSSGMLVTAIRGSLSGYKREYGERSA